MFTFPYILTIVTRNIQVRLLQHALHGATFEDTSEPCSQSAYKKLLQRTHYFYLVSTVLAARIFPGLGM